MVSIEERVEALERKVKWYRCLIVGLLLCAVAGLSMGAGEAEKVSDVLRAKRLEIVDAKGTVVFSVDSVAEKPNPHGGVTGGGRLMLFDSKGKKVVSAGSSLFGGTFEINQTRSMKQEQDVRGQLRVFATDWGAMIALVGKDGRLMWKEPTGK
ncbi:MAG: hypothetical protein GWP05_00935 [Anaerolineaceae bacterium]|nr:hypothetical protein [Anaerolineaceae bacterium]